MIRIIQNQFTQNLEIFVLQLGNLSKTHGRPTHVLHGEVWEPIEEGMPSPKPTLTINFYDVEDLVNGLQKLNIKTENEFKIEGVLKATEYHLQDLRKMLKLS